MEAQSASRAPAEDVPGTGGGQEDGEPSPGDTTAAAGGESPLVSHSATSLSAAPDEETPPPVAVVDAPTPGAPEEDAASEPQQPVPEWASNVGGEGAPATDQGRQPGKGGIFGRRSQRKGEAVCSVCQAPRPDGDPEELARLGWLQREDVYLCPDCRGDGWQLPEGSAGPMRRFSGS